MIDETEIDYEVSLKDLVKQPVPVSVIETAKNNPEKTVLFSLYYFF